MPLKGSGTITPVSAPSEPVVIEATCYGEYITVADLRAQLGTENLENATDTVLQRKIDQVSDFLDSVLGHTFGRWMRIWSNDATHTVEVTSTYLRTANTTYTFVDYPTLGDLMTAMSSLVVCDFFSLIDPRTPSTLLRPQQLVTVGPDYSRRVTLSIKQFYYVCSGNRRSHVFLPLPISTVSSVTENTIALTLSDYSFSPGTSWIIRLDNSSDSCYNNDVGKWSGLSQDNIAVTYTPSWYGHIPGQIQTAILDSLSTRLDIGGITSESFGTYSYSRSSASIQQTSWHDSLAAPQLREFTVRSTYL